MPDSGLSTTRYRYLIYGLVVESELQLTSVEACAEESAAPAVRIAFGSQDFFEKKASGLRQDCEEWIRHTVLADGSVYIRVNDVLEAVIAADGRSVVCARVGEVDDRTFEANLANFGLSASLTLRGEECLHATVVSLGGRALGFLGPSGSGKSTLSAVLVTQGASLVTDDMLRVTFGDGEILAHPGPYRLKLFEDSASRFLPGAAREGSFNRLSSKVMFQPDKVPPRARLPVPLATLFWLGEPEPPESTGEVSVKRLAGIELVKVLTRSTMNRRYLAPARLERQLRFAERLARAVPIYALDYRRDYARLDHVTAALRRTVAA